MSEENETYYILNLGLYWWRVGGHGYTQNLDEAWRVTKQEAMSICADRPTEDVAFPTSIVDAHAKYVRIVQSWCFGRHSLVPDVAKVAS